MDVHKRSLNAGVEAWNFPLAGSSFRAEDGSYRQTSLRQAFEKQEDLESILVDLERYEYDGAPAYRVYFDEREVGNVPKDVAAELARMETNGYTVFGDDCEIYGGPERDFPDKKFGARVYVRLRRKQTDAERQAALYDLARKVKQQEQTRAAAAASVPPSPVQPSPVPNRRPDEFPRPSSMTQEEYDKAVKVPRTVRKIVLILLAVCVAVYLLLNYVFPELLYYLG